MRCSRCGNENPGTNRFCGMCGATLLSPTAANDTTAPMRSAASSPSATPAPVPPVAPVIPAPVVPAPVTTAPVAAAPQSTTASRPAEPARDEQPYKQPVISGPSFLGLNEPPPRKRGSLSIDPGSAPGSGSLDYLLEDEDEPKRGGAGKFVLIVVALVLAGGFGYLRWKGQSFPWLSSGASKPAASAQSPEGDDSTAAPAGSTPTSSPAPDSSQPAPASQPAAGAAAASPTGNSAAGSPTPSTAVPLPDSAATSAAPSAASPAAAPEKDPNVDTGDAAPAPVAKPKPAPVEPTHAAHVEAAPKPRVVSKPAVADPVTEAQKYIYGKGVRQDCDHGLRILKPAADQANPKAMIEMGALYSAGLCTPRDLPTAYRWFALALHKQPDNASVQTDLQKLWSEMTQPERQLAIKLSQ